MPSETSLALPDALVAELVDRIANLAETLRIETDLLQSRRDAIRARLAAETGLERLGKLPGHSYPIETEPDLHVHAIDGAHLVKADRGAAYSLSCVVGLSPTGTISRQRVCSAVMPHFVGVSAISSGLMTMQEIMMAVEIAQAAPSAIVLIDGSRLSAFIAINQFYEAIAKDGKDILLAWRKQAAMGKKDEPSATIGEFEGRDWLSLFLTLPNIVGNLKLVTTRGLVRKYASDLMHRFDDQALANILLEVGEGVIVRFEHDGTPYHLSSDYAFAASASRAAELLCKSKQPEQLAHIYARINPMHGVYKIEVNHAFFAQKIAGATGRDLLARLVQWWGWNTAAVDIPEPYPSFVADRFASEAVKVSELAMRDILIRNSDTDVLWNLGRAYRT